MPSDRHAIFSLIALGRITPEQAERLLALSNEPSETALVLAAGIAAVVLMYGHGSGVVAELFQHLGIFVSRAAAGIHQLSTALIQF